MPPVQLTQRSKLILDNHCAHISKEINAGSLSSLSAASNSPSCPRTARGSISTRLLLQARSLCAASHPRRMQRRIQGSSHARYGLLPSGTGRSHLCRLDRAKRYDSKHEIDGLVRIIIRSQLFQRHNDDEQDAHSHTHRCGGYPEDQTLRHSLLRARFSRTIPRAPGEGCPKADVYVISLHTYLRPARSTNRSP
jgi:hypothetical protein